MLARRTDVLDEATLVGLAACTKGKALSCTGEKGKHEATRVEYMQLPRMHAPSLPAAMQRFMQCTSPGKAMHQAHIMQCNSITTHGKTQGSCRHGASTRNPQVATAANPTLLFLVGGLLRRTMIFGCFAGPSRASSAMLPCKAPEKTVLRPVCYALLCSQSNTCNQCRTQSQHEL